MKLLLLPLLLGFSVPAIAHNEFNGGESGDLRKYIPTVEGGDLDNFPGTTSVEGEGADFSPGGKVCLGANGELVSC